MPLYLSLYSLYYLFFQTYRHRKNRPPQCSLNTNERLMSDHSPTANHHAPPNDDESKPAKRIRLLDNQEEERVLRIAREARDNDALYRALLVRIHKDGYAGDNDENGSRIRKRVENYEGDGAEGESRSRDFLKLYHT